MGMVVQNIFSLCLPKCELTVFPRYTGASAVCVIWFWFATKILEIQKVLIFEKDHTQLFKVLRCYAQITSLFCSFHCMTSFFCHSCCQFFSKGCIFGTGAAARHWQFFLYVPWVIFSSPCWMYVFFTFSLSPDFILTSHEGTTKSFWTCAQISRGIFFNLRKCLPLDCRFYITQSSFLGCRFRV